MLKGIVIVIVTFFLDQLTKWWAVGYLSDQSFLNASFFEQLSYTPQKYVFPFFDLVLFGNKGISFGLFQTETSFERLLLTAFTGLIILFLFIWLLRSKKTSYIWSLSLIVGGALGNLLDRVRLEAVVDFIYLHIGPYYWPAFNIADTAISIGAVILIIVHIFFEEKKESTK